MAFLTTPLNLCFNLKHLDEFQSSLCLTKNKIKFYEERLKMEDGKANPIPASIRELNEIIDAITTQVRTGSSSHYLPLLATTCHY